MRGPVMRRRHDNRVTPRVTHVTMYPMSETYTKLFHSIISSTVWVDTPLHVKVVWIALLAKADKDGEIYSSVRGLARDAGVTTDQCHEALDLFMQPDPESRTTAAEGRRIEKIDGGWALINHAKYREKTSLADRREKDRIRQQRKRERDTRDMSRKSRHTDSYTDSDQTQTQITQKEEHPPAPKGVFSWEEELKNHPDLDTAENRKALQEWVAYRKEGKLRAWKPTTWKKNFKEWKSWSAGALVRAIDKSIGQGWLGIFEGNGGTSGKPAPPSVTYKQADYSDLGGDLGYERH